jgi:hypothetical protein
MSLGPDAVEAPALSRLLVQRRHRVRRDATEGLRQPLGL